MSSRIEGADELARDLGRAPAQAIRKIRPIMKKAGVEMKRRMAKDFQSSSSFRMIGKSVTFDVEDTASGGARNIQVEVGPDASRDRSAALAGIAYFGGARGGGGTVPEPDYILEDEAEKSVKFIGDAIAEALR